MSGSSGFPVTDVPPQIEFDFNFTSADSPRDVDINGLLGKNANRGQLFNFGPGNLSVSISSDGTNFSDTTPILQGETFTINGLNVKTLRIALANPAKSTGYRIIAADPGQELMVMTGVEINRCKADAPGVATLAAGVEGQIIPASLLRRHGIIFCNLGAMPVFLAFDGNTAVLNTGACIPKDGSLTLDSQLLDDDEVRGISQTPLTVSFQLWDE